VHHGCNPQYIDRNHAGTLIIWDRLFGTYEAEGETVVYGITKPLKSWNPLWANIHYFVELADVSRRTRRWRDKVLIWIMPPHWRPADVPMVVPEETPLKGFKFDAHAPRRTNLYVGCQFISVLVATVLLLFYMPGWNGLQRLAVATFIIWSVTNFGAVSDSRKWIRFSEPLRLLAGSALLWFIPQTTSGFVPWAWSIFFAVSLLIWTQLGQSNAQEV